MGRVLGRLLAEAGDVRAIGGLARSGSGQAAPDAGYPELRSMPDAGQLVRRADAVIDFSAPAYLEALVAHHSDALAGSALLVGTTGLDDALQARLDTLAESAAVLVAANFSVGINLLAGLVEQAARVLPADRYDIEVVETHHRRKADAPSGSALALGRAAAEARGLELEELRRDGRSGRTGARPAGEIGFHAVRGGGVVGEHAVHFLGDRERISLAHDALSRDLFGEGALVAARWLVGREPGRYGMADVLGL